MLVQHSRRDCRVDQAQAPNRCPRAAAVHASSLHSSPRHVFPTKSGYWQRLLSLLLTEMMLPAQLLVQMEMPGPPPWVGGWAACGAAGHPLAQQSLSDKVPAEPVPETACQRWLHPSAVDLRRECMMSGLLSMLGCSTLPRPSRAGLP